MTATPDALPAGVETSTPPATAKPRRTALRDLSPAFEDAPTVTLHHSPTCHAKDTDRYPGKP